MAVQIITIEDLNEFRNLLLNDLKELWLRSPDLRLCQLLSKIADDSGWKSIDLFYLEDDIIANQIKKLL